MEARPSTEYVKMPGISDLHAKVKFAFALALKAEDEGNMEKAYEYLDKALASEEELKNQKSK